MRSRKKPWADNEIELNDSILKNAEEVRGRWSYYFENEKPLHLEIGCGKGRFINELALANPQMNHVAMERDKNIIVTGARRARENGIHIGFILADVQDLEKYFAPGEIQRLYINFCDPWHRKKKWSKRRLTHRNFLKVYESLFINGGEVYFKTDNKQLFEFSLNEFSDMGWRLKNITLDLHNSDYVGNIMTEYEEKFSGQGMPIYRCEAYYPYKKEDN